MKNTLDGACGVRNEEYNDGIQHMFHRTKNIANQGRAGLIRHWTGQVGMFDEEAYVGPDVVLHPGALRFTRFMGWAYRIAPMLLPARVPAPRVAILSTDASYYEIEGTGQLFSSREMERLLKEINVPVDILRDGRFDDLDRYQVVILGGFSSMIEPKQAERLKAFVRGGGKLLIMAGGARHEGPQSPE
jgi:hypothetical protein